jgi:hypothetical protein
MGTQRRNLASVGRAVLAWSLAFYVSFQLALVVVTDRWQPALRDPEYGCKFERLRARLTKEPGRELLVILGSSRAGYGFRPEAIPAWRAPTGEPLTVFNCALTGSGPIMELLCLRRLLAAGIHPDRVLIEVLPPILHQEGTWAELNWLSINRLGWDDMRLVHRYADQPQWFCFDWWRAQIAPWFTQRFCIMSRFAPGWLHWRTRQDIWLGLDSSGWMIYPQTVLDAAERQRALEFARRQYAPALDHFRITPIADRALRELLALCRQQNIATTLLVMPEGPEFRSWYAPAARAEIDTYLSRLSRDYDIPLIDARSWLPDTAFFDSHHLHPDGATAFTQRFERAVFNECP